MAPLTWGTVMHIAIFTSLVAAWPLVIGVALVITIALTANSLFHPRKQQSVNESLNKLRRRIWTVAFTTGGI